MTSEIVLRFYPNNIVWFSKFQENSEHGLHGYVDYGDNVIIPLEF